MVDSMSHPRELHCYPLVFGCFNTMELNLCGTQGACVDMRAIAVPVWDWSCTVGNALS